MDTTNTNDNETNKFDKIINEFTNDLLLTFPELTPLLESIHNQNTYDYCCDMYPKIFFEILYENNTLFDKECFLLPSIDFSLLMKESISEKTKKTIWKYLQLILFCVLEKVNKKSFGDTSKIFEGVEEEELHKKIAETMEEMKGLFTNIDTDSSDASFNFMDPDKMKTHLDDLMNGKIGTLAKEIAEEASKTIGNEEDFMANVMKNPQKILSLVKNIGGKLEEKISSGQVKESELLEEATQIMDKIQDIPGLKEMMSKMGLNGKMDFKAMANKMQQHMKGTKTKERLQKKRDTNVKAKEANIKAKEANDIKISQTKEDTFVVKMGEPPQKSNKKKKKKEKKEKKENDVSKGLNDSNEIK
uniref:Uncharacterized protein n=1 Tax=viral metagenome TaxID=1070528 RepID=A0A6C0EUH1_9ZZZZ